MLVRDVMTPNPVTADLDTPVGEVLQILQDGAFRHVPIVDGTEVVGMVSDRDLRRIAFPVGLDEAKLEKIKATMRSPVSSWMSGDLLTIGPEEDVTAAIDLILENGIGAVPVVDESSGDLVGILSYVDILRSARDLL